jgi:anaerobic magnesium-protoporphyrin IX monomethyl ester cyclase
MNRQALFQNIINIVQERANDSSNKKLLESLAYDYARCERIVINRIPDFFDTELDSVEQEWAQKAVQSKTEEIKGQGIKLQYFATVFTTLHISGHRAVYLFCYLTSTGQKMRIEEYCFTGEDQ